MVKYQEVKDDLISLYNTAKETLPVHSIPDEDFIIYRGYKICKKNDESDYVYVVTVRQSDFYRQLTDRDLKMCIKLGFEKFADMKQIQYDERRIEQITKKVRYYIENDINTKELVAERKELFRRISRLTKKWQYFRT